FFVLRPGVALSAVAAAVASVGFAATLVLQERLLALTPDDLAGQALGLHATGTAALQGTAAALAGALLLDAGLAVVLGVALALLVVAAAVTRRLAATDAAWIRP
ncbi:MFS transporter, partial [Streptomyces sp. NPDC056534]